ncbi:MAG: OprO/OprP family phosphate-selective porin [Gemmatales bacterium]|nr:OprO/OprP family phosphate-selective porin [Gemmatales bacterium]MDW8387683.1 porin [Gemmatales bacterium]
MVRYVGGLIVLFLVLSSGFAQQPGDDSSNPAESVEDRLARLEEQNASLLRMIETLEQKQQEQAKSGQSSSSSSGSKSGSGGSSEALTFKVTWRDQLYFQTSDRAFRLHVGGRFHFDFAWFTAEDQVETGPGGVGPLEDAVNFRRARLRMEGTIYEQINFVSEYDFTNQRDDRGNFLGSGIFDNYIEIAQLPIIGHFRAGHFREPFSYDALVSGNDLMFLERSLLQDAFVPFRNMGMMVWDSVLEDRITWWAGWFFANASNVNATEAQDGNYAGTVRLGWCPYYEDDGCRAIHLGAAYSYRKTIADPAGGLDFTLFAARPECRVVTPLFANTGRIASPRYQLFGAEFAAVWHRFQVQSEYMAALVDDAIWPYVGGVPRGDAFFQGFYVQASCFLTGECRPYNLVEKRPSRLKPVENFFVWGNEETAWALPKHCGWGAWEIACRYSHLDLINSGIRGGILDDVTLGLNWYLNPNTKVQWNYILVLRDAPNPASSGTAQIFTMRFAIDW